MAGARGEDTSPANPNLQLSRHGMLLRSISGPSRLLANRLMEERACLRGAEGIASKVAEQVGVSTTGARERRIACPKADSYVAEIELPREEQLTRWRTDPRKASAKKAGDRVGARNGIRSPDRVVGS